MRERTLNDRLHAGGMGCFEVEAYQTTPTKPLAADGSVHRWSLDYDPAGAAGNGLVTFTLDGRSWNLPLQPGHKADGAVFNRFGTYRDERGQVRPFL